MKRFFQVLRWLSTGFGLLIFGLVLFAIFYTEPLPKTNVLRVVLDGRAIETSQPNLGAWFGMRTHNTLQDVLTAIRQSAQDDRILGLVLELRSPEWGLAQLAELHEAMVVFQASHKPNVAYLATTGENGHADMAYAAACAAQKIVLSPPGEISFTGLRAEVPFIKETLKRLHVQVTTEQRYEYKNFANTFNQDNFTPAHLESLKSVLDNLQDSLLKMIGQSRRVEVQQARAWVQGAPYAATEALEQHLVDSLAYWDEVQATAQALAKRPEPFVSVETYLQHLPKPKKSSQEVDIAYIGGSGEISMGDGGQSPFEAREAMGSQTLIDAFTQARQKPVKGVLFRIDSPGGSYVASDLIRREVELTRQAGIPVVVSMGNTAASGGYFVAVDADAIVAQPGTITGSIGVVAAAFGLRDFFQHFLGVSFGVYETLPHPGTLSWLDAPTPADREQLSKQLDRIYNDFVNKVAKGRRKTYKEIHQVAKGRIWSGEQALSYGLVDALGGIETATQLLRQHMKLNDDDTIHWLHYPQPQTPIEALRDLLINRQGTNMNIQTVHRLLKAQATAWQQHVVQLPIKLYESQ